MRAAESLSIRTCTHGALAHVAVLAAVFVQSALAHEFYDGGGLQVQGSVLARSGIRYGSGINFGAGALTGFGRYFKPTGVAERVDLEFSNLGANNLMPTALTPDP